MMSNPDEGGVERLTISALRPQMGGSPEHSLCLSDLDGSEVEDVNFADPHSFMVVKGWTRMFCCYAVLLCCQQQPGFLEAFGAGKVKAIHTLTCQTRNFNSTANNRFFLKGLHASCGSNFLLHMVHGASLVCKLIARCWMIPSRCLLASEEPVLSDSDM